MDNKFSTIKERCLQIAKYKGFSLEDFCSKIGMTYGNFKGPAKKTPLNSNAIENILSIIPDVSADWLLTGRGSMLKPPGLMDDAEIAAQDEEVRQGKVSVYQYDPKNAIITAKDEAIAAHKKTIASNEVTIGALQARIRDLEAQLHSSSTVLDNAPAVDIPSVGARTQTSAK